MFRCFVYLILSGIIASSALAATYYVDIDGVGGQSSDNNPGTITQPWNSVFKAFSSALPGDTIIFRKGTYRQAWPISARHIASGATAQSRITFKGYTGEKAVITSMTLADDPALWTLEQGKIYSMPLNYVQDLRQIASVSQDGVQLKLMTDVNENGNVLDLTGPGQWVRDVNEQKLYVWSTRGINPASQHTEIGEMAFGGHGVISIYPDPAIAGVQPGYLTFDNLTFEGGTTPLAVGTNGIVIKNCVFKNCSGSGLVIGGTDLGLADSNDPNMQFSVAQGGTVENCEFSSFGGSAIALVGGDSWTIRGNKIHDNTINAVNHACAISVNDADNTVIERNTIYNLIAGSAVIDLDSSITDASRLFNTIIKNNIIANVTASEVLSLAAVTNCGIYNNLVYKATVSRALIECIAVKNQDGSFELSDLITVKNNIFAANSANLLGHKYQYYLNASSITRLATGFNAVDPSFTYFLQGQEKTLGAFCALGYETGSITSTPAFADVANMDFHLAAASSVIGKGCSLAGVVADDFDGNARTQNALYDIGPFCYSNSGSNDGATQTNTLPVFNMLSTVTVRENQLCAFTAAATDADNDALTYAATNLPAGATFSNNTFIWMPSFMQAGVYSINFSASDGKGTAFKNVQITVTENNRSPLLGAISAKAITCGKLLAFTVSANDPDGDALTYSCRNLPAGATFANGTFSWTPAKNQAGTYSLVLSVTDGKATASQTVTVVVNLTNTAPVLGSIGSRSGTENQPMTIVLDASDADGTTLTYSAMPLPAGARMSGKTFTWTPSYTQAGTYKVTFTVSDGKAKASQTVVITIGNVDRRPVFGAIGNRSLNEGEILKFTLSATDPDGTKVAFAAAGMPRGARLVGNVFTWKPDNTQAGIYNVTFAVGSGGATLTQTIQIVVRDMDRAPVLMPVAAKTVREGTTLRFAINASDPDGTSIKYAAYNLPRGAKLTGNVLTWTPDYAQAGTYNVTFAAGSGTTNVTTTAKITVLNVR